MASEEYEFVPTKDFEKVQAELAKLKQNPFLSKTESKDMKSSIDTLHSSVDNLLGVFKQAHRELTQEERESRVFKRELQPLTDRFEKIEANQETIANGVVVVSDAITKLSHKVNGLHGEFDKLHDMLLKIGRQVDKISKPDAPDTSSGSKVTRKYYTTRQYQQPNPLGAQNTTDVPPPPIGSMPPPADPVASSLYSAQLDASLGSMPPSSRGTEGSYYASPITTTIESAPLPPPGAPSNQIPPMGQNDLGANPAKKDSGFSLFKK